MPEKPLFATGFGYGGGLDVETLWQVGQVAIGGLMPDLTIVLDMPAKSAVGRIERELDRMEKQGAEFHSRVREGFLIEAARRKDIVVINAAQSIEKVQEDIRDAVMKRRE